MKSRPAFYRFGPYEVDTARNELRKHAIRLRIERKPWQLLIVLLDRAGAVVARAELHRSLWQQEVFVDFDKGLTVAVTKLRAILNDSADNPKYIETVPGEGYRFIASVDRVFATAPPPSPTEVSSEPTLAVALAETQPPVLLTANGTQPPKTFHKRSRFIAAAALISVAVLVFALVLTGSTFLRKIAQPQPVRSAKTMLVVLPFENLSGDPTEEYLADGVTEELSARLGNLDPQHLGVIGRTSAMTYKGAKHTINEIGKELSVSYVLEGSVRREGTKLRIAAQLVNVSDQAHVWADHYDREVRNLVQVEDEVASDIAREVGVSLAVAQPTKRLHPHVPTPEAHKRILSVVIIGTSARLRDGGRASSTFAGPSRRTLNTQRHMPAWLSAASTQRKLLQRPGKRWN